MCVCVCVCASLHIQKIIFSTPLDYNAVNTFNIFLKIGLLLRLDSFMKMSL